jgi:hypothetical protein
MEVMLNLHQWNIDILNIQGQSRWGKRTVTYFVVDQQTGMCAPSKFCSYIALPSHAGHMGSQELSRMTIPFYSQIDANHSLFDGNRAWNHLVNNLAMEVIEPDQMPFLYDMFARWLKNNENFVNVHPAGPKFIIAPKWFR